jgi:hypothetical protein
MIVSRRVKVTSLTRQRSSCLRSVCVVVGACQTAGTSWASARIRWRSSGLTGRMARVLHRVTPLCRTPDTIQRRLAHLRDLIRRLRHLPGQDQGNNLNQVLRGHYAYYGIAGNCHAVQRVHRAVERSWAEIVGSLPPDQSTMSVAVDDCAVRHSLKSVVR